MKKILLITLTILFSIASANAQKFKKGDKSLSLGSTGIAIEEINDVWQFSVGLNGNIFLHDKIALDAGAMFIGGDAELTDVFQIGIGAKVYPVKELFVSATPIYAHISEAVEKNHFLLQFGLGYDIFVKENIYIEPAIYYNIQLTDDKAVYNPESKKDEKFDLTGFGFALSIGVKF